MHFLVGMIFFLGSFFPYNSSDLIQPQCTSVLVDRQSVKVDDELSITFEDYPSYAYKYYLSRNSSISVDPRNDVLQSTGSRCEIHWPKVSIENSLAEEKIQATLNTFFKERISENVVYEESVWFEASLLELDILKVIVNWRVYEFRASHGRGTRDPYYFDLHTGEQLYAEDILDTRYDGWKMELLTYLNEEQGWLGNNQTDMKYTDWDLEIHPESVTVIYQNNITGYPIEYEHKFEKDKDKP